MKKKIICSISFLLVILVIGFAPTLVKGEEFDSATAPENYVPEELTEPVIMGTEKLIVQDVLPWGGGYYGPHTPDQVLIDRGESFNKIPISDLATHDLSEYRVIIISSDQLTSSYNNLITNKHKLENFVSSGGVLIAHACDIGWSVGHWASSFLPGGVFHEHQYTDFVQIAMSSHPIVNTPHLITDTQLQGWFYSAHGYFTNLVPGTNVIIEDGYDRPTYIEYRWGTGLVLANLMPMEWHASEYDLTKNEIDYAQAYTPILPPEVSKAVTPEEIEFGTGEMATVTISVTGAGGTETTITPMDVVFAIDSSGSMGWNDPYNLRKTAAKSFVDNMLCTRDQGGVVSWDDNIDFIHGLTQDFPTLKSQIDLVDSYGGTNLNVGLFGAIAMLDAGKQAGSTRVIIFLTDGQGSYTPSGYPGSLTDDAASKGYIIYSIGLNSPTPTPLIDMATTTGGLYYSSPSAENLQAIFDAIYEEVVTSTIPHYVNVTEVTQSYIVVDEGSFSIIPDSISHNLDGTTTMFWENIGMEVDSDPDLSADETVLLTFDIKPKISGDDLEVDVDGEAIVEYSDKDKEYFGYVDIPQATITVRPFVKKLIAGGGNPASAIDVGEVIIWTDDPDFLYITYESTDGWYITETHLHVNDSLEDIPQTKKNNPIPGHFDYKGVHDPPVQEYTYTIPWTWDPGTTLYIAAHAEVIKIVESCFEIVSDESVLWSSDGCSWENSYPSYVHPSWPSDPSIEGATWIWRTSLTDPALEYATVPDGGWYFQKIFNIPGTPTSGEISINVDNAYELYLNDVIVGGEGSMSKDGPDFYEWNTIQSFDLFDYLNSNYNTLLIRALNYFNTGTANSNPAGIIFKMQVCYEYIEMEETAWGDGEDFLGNNWATYMIFIDP